MVLDWTEPGAIPGEGHDLLGQELPGTTFRVDTLKGTVDFYPYRIDSKGKEVPTHELTEDGTELLRCRRQFVPPLTVYLYA